MYITLNGNSINIDGSTSSMELYEFFGSWSAVDLIIAEIS